MCVTAVMYKGNLPWYNAVVTIWRFSNGQSLKLLHTGSVLKFSCKIIAQEQCQKWFGSVPYTNFEGQNKKTLIQQWVLLKKYFRDPTNVFGLPGKVACLPVAKPALQSNISKQWTWHMFQHRKAERRPLNNGQTLNLEKQHNTEFFSKSHKSCVLRC